MDLIFIDYIESDILGYLDTVTPVNGTYTDADVQYYIDDTFSTQTYLPLYVQTADEFQRDADNCTIY